MFRSITTIVATLAASGFVHAQNAVPWTEAEGGNGHWYQLVDTGSITWANANTQVQGTGGHLATLTSPSENTFVLNAIDNSGSIRPWIGLYQDTEADDYSEPFGGWRWVTGEAYDWTNWNLSEPSDGGVFGSENEVNIWLSGSGQPLGTWNDYRGALADGYVVEYSADCNGDGIVDYGQILDGSLTDDNGNGIPDCCEENNCFGPEAVQWEVENDGNGHWYQGIAAPEISWDDAAAQAASVGGYLCTVPTELENLWVFENVASDPSLWNGWYGPFIGGYQDLNADDYSEPAGGWRWVTGEEWSYTAWTPGDPSNNGPQDHLAYGGVNGNPIQPLWNDLEAPEPGGYVVEWSSDCNGDGIVDYGQLLDGTLEDLDGNGIPDCCDQGYACFPPDCNNNEIDDAIDIGNGTSQDCNTNGIPDECDLASGDSEDCNSNDTPDECESLGDCDGDGTPDTCEILNGAVDANPADGIPDQCQGLPLGACCYNGGCLMSTFDDCFSAGGSFAGNGVGCADAECPQPCPGDVTNDGKVDVIDLLTIINYWGVCP